MKTINKENIPEDFSEFECGNGKVYVCRSNACPFCIHCEIFYDFTNGPYLFLCDKEGNVSEAFEGKCKLYERINK